ncbi:MAG: MgtC/SapB family protein [Clostridia bacterium]|nr:MgtC/SapB family protein [Clostridia bacterium]
MKFVDSNQLIFLLRIFLACVCGFVIGFERKNRSKEAGIRTHCVVASAAALMMIVSKYAFFDVVQSDLFPGVDVRLDPSRVASTIASGIGFLGAGMIFVQKSTVTGLTTAAGIWATSGVGMAMGAGMYFIAICATLIVVMVQIIFHLKFRWLKVMRVKELRIQNVAEEGYLAQMKNEFAKRKILINNVSIEKVADCRNFTFTVEIPREIDEEELMMSINYDCSLKSNA